MYDDLKIPYLFLAATQDDSFRKPSKGMFTYLSTTLNEDTKIDMDTSFYCGDAAGRPATKDRKKDFSDTDRVYAANTGLKFYTPEQYFLDQNEEIKRDFDLRKYQKNEGKSLFEDEKAEICSDEQEVIIFVGPPGSGKSTFWSNHLKKYVRVNNDTLKTAEKCMAALRAALKEKKSAVIDNTNKSKEEWKRYIDIAKEFKVPVRCFYFKYPKDLAMAMNKHRETNKHWVHHSKKVGSVVIHTFYKYVEEPSKAEGLSEV